MDDFRNLKSKKKYAASTDGFLVRRGSSEAPQNSEGTLSRRQSDADRQVSQSEGVDLSASSEQVENRRKSRNQANVSYEPRVARRASGDRKRRSKKQKSGSFLRIKNPMKVVKRVGVFAMLLLLLGTGFLFGKAYLTARNVLEGGGAAIFDENVDPSELKREGDGRINILMLGFEDVRPDSIIVSSIDPIHNEAGVVSIPRDLWVRPDGLWAMKINGVYVSEYNRAKGLGKSDEEAKTAGLKKLEETITHVLGIPIHYYVTIDFDGFVQAVDAVGGVKINVKSPVRASVPVPGKPRFNLDVQPGSHKFDGETALHYARVRAKGCFVGCLRGDFDRSERQREVLSALQKKILTVGTFANPWKVSELLSSLENNVRTSLSLDDLMRLYDIGKKMEDDLISIELVDPENPLLKTGNIGGASVVLPIAGDGNFTEIRKYIFKKLPDSFMKKEKARVMVLNGRGTPGLATTTAETLRSYGYKVGHIGDTPNGYSGETVVINLTGDDVKYTNRYLELRFNTKSIDRMPFDFDTTGHDFVIILGSNE